ncbi:MAG: hypothetical protein LBH22_06265, partial [Bacteroidales bacterium]|nr:hypothetical protein [Bacteroidales bacterium]
MKKLLQLILLLLMAQGSVSLKAQMRIGGSTAPNPNAILDLNESETSIGSKGLLLPRVALESTTSFSPLTAHVRGMYVYNTGTAKGMTPGVYYNDGTKWIRAMGDSDVGETILNYLINNLTQEFVDSIMANVNIASADNTVNVVGSGTSSIDLAVNMATIIDSLISNETFINNLVSNLVNNQTFIDGLINNNYFIEQLITNLVNNQTFIDELINNNYFIEELITNLVNNQTFIDELINNNYFIEELITNLVNNQTFI